MFVDGDLGLRTKTMPRNRACISSCLLRGVGAAAQRDEESGFDRRLYVVMSEQGKGKGRLGGRDILDVGIPVILQ